MGCDIHFVVETKKKDEDVWTGVYSTDLSPHMPGEALAKKALTDEQVDYAFEFNYTRPVFKGRYYSFFGALAGVRTDGPEPLGMPKNASDLAKMCAEDWGADGHSHSYAPLREFITKWISVTNPDVLVVERMTNPRELNDRINALAGNYVLEDANREYRVVFWFDN